MVVSINDSSVVTDNTEDAKRMFAIWKDNIEVSAPSGKGGGSASPSQYSEIASSDVSITGVMKEILAFPIESKSPVESMLFLAALKSKLSKII